MGWYWRLDAGEEVFWSFVGVCPDLLGCLDAKATKRYLGVPTSLHVLTYTEWVAKYLQYTATAIRYVPQV
jgi:hypothetical protein